MSLWCARLIDQNTGRSPSNTGTKAVRSGRWLPPWYGSFSRNTSPGWMSPPKNSVHRLRRPGQRADMDRHMLGLRDQPAVEVADRGGEIAAGIEDLRIRGAQHRLAHLLDDGVQPVLHDRDGHRIDGVSHTLPPWIVPIPYAPGEDCR